MVCCAVGKQRSAVMQSKFRGMFSPPKAQVGARLAESSNVADITGVMGVTKAGKPVTL